MEDLIYTQGSGTVRGRINAELAVSQGWVLSLSQQLGLATRLTASYTRTRSEVKQNSQSRASEGKELSSMPRDQATLGMDTRLGDWTLAGNLRYASKQYSTDDNSDIASHVFQSYDAYTLLDARLAYRVDKNVSVALAVDNLLDRAYYSYYIAPRRSWFASLNFAY
jgi:iron complex outermembrane receptor protein